MPFPHQSIPTEQAGMEGLKLSMGLHKPYGWPDIWASKTEWGIYILMPSVTPAYLAREPFKLSEV